MTSSSRQQPVLSLYVRTPAFLHLSPVSSQVISCNLSSSSRLKVSILFFSREFLGKIVLCSSCDPIYVCSLVRERRRIQIPAFSKVAPSPFTPLRSPLPSLTRFARLLYYLRPTMIRLLRWLVRETNCDFFPPDGFFFPLRSVIEVMISSF